MGLQQELLRLLMFNGVFGKAYPLSMLLSGHPILSQAFFGKPYPGSKLFYGDPIFSTCCLKEMLSCSKVFLTKSYPCPRVALRPTLANVSRKSLFVPLSEASFEANFSECFKEILVCTFV